MISDLTNALGLGTAPMSSSRISGLLPLIGLLRTLGDFKSLIRSDHLKTATRFFYAAVAYRLLAFVKGYLKRLFIRRAVISGPDQAFKWSLYFCARYPRFRSSPGVIDVAAKLHTSLSRAKGDGSIQDESVVPEGQETIKDESEENRSKRIKAEKKEKDAGRGIFFLPAVSDERRYFWFESTLFWIVRGRESGIILSCLSLTTKPLAQFMRQVRDDYLALGGKEEIEIFHVDPFRAEWKSVKSLTARPIDSLFLSKALKADVLNDAKTFYSDERLELYKRLKIPYRRGYLFYGPPGVGKSSLVNALATELSEPIYLLQLSLLDDDTFTKAMDNLPSRGLLLIEDIDAAYIKREATSTFTRYGSKRSGVSFDVLLNALDSVYAAQGRLLLMTTNHIEKLDKALIREGRIDRRFEIKNASMEQARDLFLHCCLIPGAEEEKIRLQAETFAQSIPPYKYSIAAVQGYLLQHVLDPQGAIRGVELWVKQKEEEMMEGELRSGDAEGSKSKMRD